MPGERFGARRGVDSRMTNGPDDADHVQSATTIQFRSRGERPLGANPATPESVCDVAALGMGPGLSGLRLDSDAVTIAMGWAFRARIPVDQVRDATTATVPVVGGWGVHGWGGRWLVNGSLGGIVRLRIEPPVLSRAVGVPVRLRTLWVSLEDPEGFLAELAVARNQPAPP
jgi:hypothetical protein